MRCKLGPSPHESRSHLKVTKAPIEVASQVATSILHTSSLHHTCEYPNMQIIIQIFQQQCLNSNILVKQPCQTKSSQIERRKRKSVSLKVFLLLVRLNTVLSSPPCFLSPILYLKFNLRGQITFIDCCYLYFFQSKRSVQRLAA